LPAGHFHRLDCEPYRWQVKSHVIPHKPKYTQPSAHANECWR
jgi:hypothetical protein